MRTKALEANPLCFLLIPWIQGKEAPLVLGCVLSLLLVFFQMSVRMLHLLIFRAVSWVKMHRVGSQSQGIFHASWHSEDLRYNEFQSAPSRTLPTHPAQLIDFQSLFLSLTLLFSCGLLFKTFYFMLKPS